MVYEKLIGILESICGYKLSEEDYNSDLIENGILNSEGLIILMIEIQRTFDIEIQPTQVDPKVWRSLKLLAEFIKKKKVA